MALAQRRGESDEEYEKRKKRVKRQRQGIGEDMFARMGGGGGGGGSGSSGHCITQGTDGTNYGIKRSLPTPFGSVDPERTPEGVLIYDFYCQASGEAVLRLGDDGEYEVPGIIQLDISYNTDQVLTMTWLALENMYIATDHDFTDYATAIPVDEEYCVDITRIPVDLPTQPTLLRVGSTTDTSISLLWNASTQGTYPIASYNVQADALLIGTPASNAFTWNSCPPNEEVSYRVQAVDNQGNIGPWSNTLVYTNEVAVAPIYLMTEPLFNDGSFDYLVDSANTVTDHYGQLLTSGDTAWNPDSTQYPEDGTIDFSGGNKADTQWIAPQDEEWTMSGVYNVVMDVSYDMYSIHYKGNQTCDIYLNGVLSESDKDYTPPTGTWILEEEPPDIIIPEDPYGPELIPDWATSSWGGQPSQLDLEQVGGTVKWTANQTATVTNAPYIHSDTLAAGNYRATFEMSVNEFDHVEMRPSLYNNTTAGEVPITSESGTVVYTGLLTFAYTFTLPAEESVRIPTFDRTDTTVTLGQVLEVISMSVKEIL